MNNNWKFGLGGLAAIIVAIIAWKLTFKFGLFALVFVAGVYVGYRWGRGSKPKE